MNPLIDQAVPLTPLGTCRVRQLGLQNYTSCHQAMIQSIDAREPTSIDEIWLLEHPTVFTLGQASNRAHILQTSEIPIIQSDRGGQVTYHGPGQLISYVLLDIKRQQLTIRQLVSCLENALIDYLSTQGLTATARREAPGVYIDGAKIASVGLRIRRGYSLHGLAFNINMDLSPFKLINPCGYANLAITQLADFIPNIRVDDVITPWIKILLSHLGYNSESFIT